MQLSKRAGRRALAVAAMAAALAFPAAPSVGADDPPADPPEAAGEPAPSGAASGEDAPAIQPDAISSFQTRTYRIRPRKLWEGVLQTLKDSGYPPEEVDDGSMHAKTSFIDFAAADYSEEVAEAPPRLTADYQVLQMMKVRAGKVSLEAIVAPEKSGAALSLRARILVQGLDRRRRILVLADRRSSGVIESDVLRHVEDTLKLKRF